MAARVADVLLDLTATAIASGDRFLSSTSELAGVLRHSADAVALLNVGEAIQLPPKTLDRCGKLADTLRASGFVEEKVKQVLRALFCTHLLGPR